jgi:hypothetical protein
MIVSSKVLVQSNIIASLFPRVYKCLSAKSLSFYSTTAASRKVAILGAAGCIGQPLSMLFKLSPEVSELAYFHTVVSRLAHESVFLQFVRIKLKTLPALH